MKKKFFAMYALVGALVASPVFTSCVDDSVSPSVEAIRNAKAEQLKAAAELSKAQAAVQAIEAEAYAELQKAQAAYYQAQAAEKNEATKEAAEKFAAKLELIKAKAEKELLAVQKEILTNKETLADNDLTRFAALMKNYTDALDDLTDLKGKLLIANNTLAGLEAGVITVEATNKETIYKNEQTIKQKEAVIALLKDPAYAALDDKELAAKIAVADKELELAMDVFNTSDPSIKALIEASAVLKEKSLAADKMDKAIDIVNGLDPYNIGTFIETSGGESWTAGNLLYYTEAYAYVNSGSVRYNYYSEYNSTFAVERNVIFNEEEILLAKRYFAGNVETYAKALGKETDAKDTKTEEGSNVLTAYAKLAAANALMTEAEAETDETQKASKIATAEMDIAKAKDALTTALKNYNDAVEKQNKFNEALAAVVSAEAANKVAAEWDAAKKAYDDAKKAFEKAAFDNLSEKGIEVYAMERISLYANEDIQGTIITLEKEIAEAKQAIEGAKVNNAQQTLDAKKAEIADLEYKIELQEKLVAEHKAMLDAYLAEDETTEEA